MQLSKLFTPILAAVAGLVAPASAQRIGPSHLCTPTGDGFCTLGVFSVSNPTGHFVTVYDSSCRWLGTLANNDNPLPPSGTWTFHSQLPYTIELTIDRPDDRQARGYFWYKGRQTILDSGFRSNCNDADDWTSCLRVAFNCS
ncbi:hypothetical protein GGTG_12751 [Gaeumannomyces tritici R3-111a-1]|uniref:Uncharacterized protein n=1 Tax=Gaeumannomyces tritici (strain R3-111a-1) TaxID=644352 RepID=J3PGX1_GAET3|nr:hypothetical protein GGTG_12751 [Gaeumannomyces tritici R3-111a-1]EJT69868.1 hypothetical protein GGTG_12751 [Gaeumannomyces tritici R3-111a-1]